MNSPRFSIKDRMLAVPILLAGTFCVLRLVSGVVIIPSASLCMMVLVVPILLWFFSILFKRARPVHKLSLVLGIIALFIHPEMISAYTDGWYKSPEVFVSKGIEKEISPESVLKAKIQNASDHRKRSFWVNKLIQHLYVTDLWNRQNDRFSYILHPPTLVLLLLAILISLLSPAGDSLIMDIFNPNRDN